MATTNKLRIQDLQQLKSVVELLKPYHVKRVVIDGIEIEFDTAAALLSRSDAPDTIDETQARKNTVVKGLADLLKDAEADELWSAAP